MMKKYKQKILRTSHVSMAINNWVLPKLVIFLSMAHDCFLQCLILPNMSTSPSAHSIFHNHHCYIQVGDAGHTAEFSTMEFNTTLDKFFKFSNFGAEMGKGYHNSSRQYALFTSKYAENHQNAF